MKKSEVQKVEALNNDDLEIIEGEITMAADGGGEILEEETVISPRVENAVSFPLTLDEKTTYSMVWLQYIVLPTLFLLVTLLGGLRLGALAGEFLFLKPALVCLIFAVMLLVLFFRSRLIQLEGWFSDDFTPLKNVSNAGVLLTLFAASTQVFNSLLPEQGLPFWIIAFFFLWSLGTNLFAEFNPKKLLTSLGSLFGIAFMTKYLILANLTAPGSGGFVDALFSGNLTKEAITYLLDLPRFAAGTGYIQFFALFFYLIGLYLLSPATAKIK